MEPAPLPLRICFAFLNKNQHINFIYANITLFQISELTLPEKTWEW